MRSRRTDKDSRQVKCLCLGDGHVKFVVTWRDVKSTMNFLSQRNVSTGLRGRE